jgi:hypothetical protein
VNRNLHRIIAACLYLAGGSLVAQQPTAPASGAGYDHSTAPQIRAERIAEAIHINGHLDEPAWGKATPATKFTQRDPKEGQPASEPTEVRVLIGDDALYVGARMHDKPSNIRPRLSRRDEPVDGDVFAVSLDSRHDHISAYYFRVTAGGAVRDATISGLGNLDLSWDAVWEAKVSTDSSGWSAEIRIPLSQLPYNRNADTWGVQFERYSWNKQEQDFFAFTPKTQTGGVNRFGHLTGLGSLPAPAKIELLPYVSTRAEYLDVAPGNPFRDRSSYAGSVGLDFKYRLSSNLTMNATVNPDFGQVEVDPAVVNLTAFETFFPEKRPFFVAERDLFGFGDIRTFNSYGVPTLFFSRRIGRQPQRALFGPDIAYVDAPEQTTINAAAKVTGKTSGGWSLAFLDALTAPEKARFSGADGSRGTEPVEPFTNYFVSRVRREINQANTAIGGLLTAVTRDLSNDVLESQLRRSAYIGGIDLNHSWRNRSWFFDGSLAASSVAGTKDVIAATQRSSAHYFQRPDARHLTYDPDRTNLTGTFGQAALIKASAPWGGNLAYQWTSPSFESNDLGFERTGDRRAFSTDFHYIQTKPGRLWRDWTLGQFNNFTWNYDGDIVFNNYAAFLETTLSNFSHVYVRTDVSGRTYDDRLTRGGPVARIPSSLSTDIFYATDRRKRWSAELEWARSRDKPGQSQQGFSVSLAVQPAPGMRLTFSPQYSVGHSLSQFITSAPDPLAGSTFGRRYVFATLDQRSLAMVTRADWTFTPTLSLQLYAQPFVASGDYKDFKELDAGRTFDFSVYGRDRGSIVPEDGAYTIDPDANPATANSITIGNPNFNFRSLRGNAVVRWEYRPGSTLFFVWQQQRSGEEALGNFRFGRDYGALFRQRPENVFTVKATYWLAR